MVGSFFLTVLLLAPVPVAGQSTADSTHVVVRAVSQDAKVIQDPVGGARITIREVDTGRILAQGMQTGDSGSTRLIMEEPRVRGELIYEGAAKFAANLPLERPTVVEITAEGPLAHPQAIQKTSKTMLLTPGDDIRGDGIILTLHGFIVEIQSPQESLELSTDDRLDIRATVQMMCGCPTAPGGMWDADGMDIEARLLRDGQIVSRTSLAFTGTQSTYEGSMQVSDAGQYTLQVLSADPDRINVGMQEQTVTVR